MNQSINTDSKNIKEPQQIRYRDNFWRRENYSNEYETVLTFVA